MSAGPVPLFGAPDPALPLVERPGAYGVALDGAGRVAAVRSAKGLLHLPGGGCDPGETPEDALVREVREELGRACRVLRFLGRADVFASAPEEGACFVKRGAFFRIALGGALTGVVAECATLWLTEAEFAAGAAEGSHVWAVERVLGSRNRSGGRLAPPPA